MELHKDSGSLRVIIDVSYESADEFIDFIENEQCQFIESLGVEGCLLYTSPSPRDSFRSRMPSSA